MKVVFCIAIKQVFQTCNQLMKTNCCAKQKVLVFVLLLLTTAVINLIIMLILLVENPRFNSLDWQCKAKGSSG